MSDKNDYVNSRGNPAPGTPTTLPSWLKDFNGLVGIGMSNPGEGELILRRADPHIENADGVGPDRTASEGPQKLGLSGLPDVR